MVVQYGNKPLGACFTPQVSINCYFFALAANRAADNEADSS